MFGELLPCRTRLFLRPGFGPVPLYPLPYPTRKIIYGKIFLHTNSFLRDRKLRDEPVGVRLWSSGGITMRIDSHLHLWQYAPDEFEWIPDSMASLRRDFLPQELSALCANAAV